MVSEAAGSADDYFRQIRERQDFLRAITSAPVTETPHECTPYVHLEDGKPYDCPSCSWYKGPRADDAALREQNAAREAKLSKQAPAVLAEVTSG